MSVRVDAGELHQLQLSNTTDLTEPEEDER